MAVRGAPNPAKIVNKEILELQPISSWRSESDSVSREFVHSISQVLKIEGSMV